MPGTDMVQVRRTGGRDFERPDVSIRRSQFDRSHGRKMTFDASYLYPILVDEVLPGDTFTLKMNGFCRIFAPLDAPVMDNIELRTEFFFVPTRLVWSSWEAFNGAHGSAGAQDSDFTIPILHSGWTSNHEAGVTGDNLMAYMGIPHGTQSANVEICSLPFRAYNLIYNEWYRDQNLIDEAVVNTSDDTSIVARYPIRKSAKKHDYFTSSLPYMQKGDPVTIKFSGDAPIITEASQNQTVGVYSEGEDAWRQLDSNLAQVDVSVTGATSGKLYADLTSSLGPTLTINSLRESVAIQRLLERDARGGTRYVEMIKSQFGVTSPDFRLQRPEYLGGGRSMVNISPVANQSGTGTQGNLAGIGAGALVGHGFAKSFTEHGYIIGLIRARGDITYFQGLDRMWSRSTRYDFYIPALANLGEQAILNKELYVSNSSGTDDSVFGYQERWSEYRNKQSQVVGLFNPGVSGNLGFWHLAESFGSVPGLNQTFIEDATPMSRIKVSELEDDPDFILDAWFDYKCARPMPVYSVPSLMAGRF